MERSNRNPRTHRSGTIAVMAAFLIVFMLGMIAFAVDLGYLAIAHTELQRTADAAALAATWELIESSPSGPPDLTAEIASARSLAIQYAGANHVCNAGPVVDGNSGNSTTGDVVVGYISDPTNPACAMDFSDPDKYNAVQVSVRRTSQSNGEVPFFFARVFGQQGKPMSGQATAALINNVSGFRAPSAGGTIDLLPYALDEETWDAMMAGVGSDSYAYNAATGAVTCGSDGVLEVNLFPQGTGSPGNRGTVDIGGNNNSTADIARQIVDGISEGDLSYFPDGELEFDNLGECDLNGDTGISAGVKDELASIIGDPRIIPVFSSVTGPGNNANYTIVKWVGIRILYVKLTGSMSSKQVIIQPAIVQLYGAIPSPIDNTSSGVYSPVWLVR